MGIEIERKFLVDRDALPPLESGKYISQGYIATQSNTTVRARIKGEMGYLTLKGENTGISRSEFEYEIPVEDAREIIASLCNGKVVEKTRYEIHVGNHIWEVDIFHGDNDGLVVAEIELSHEEEHFELPEWTTKEVSGQPQYYNSSLLNYPYSNWN